MTGPCQCSDGDSPQASRRTSTPLPDNCLLTQGSLPVSTSLIHSGPGVCDLCAANPGPTTGARLPVRGRRTPASEGCGTWGGRRADLAMQTPPYFSSESLHFARRFIDSQRESWASPALASLSEDLSDLAQLFESRPPPVRNEFRLSRNPLNERFPHSRVKRRRGRSQLGRKRGR